MLSCAAAADDEEDEDDDEEDDEEDEDEEAISEEPRQDSATAHRKGFLDHRNEWVAEGDTPYTPKSHRA